jgi:ketosteroid isomerase-like protein
MSDRKNQLYPYEYYVQMVEEKYFANVDRKDLAATLDCFCEDAVFTIQSAFTTHEGRDRGVKRMFETFFENYTSGAHKDFRHVVDVEHERCASQFNVELVTADGAQTKLSNCNFFYFENGKFKRVFVYMSGENVLV